MLVEGEELWDAAVCSTTLAPIAIPRCFDLVGFELPLVGEVRVPAARVVIYGGHVDVFYDDALASAPL